MPKWMWKKLHKKWNTAVSEHSQGERLTYLLICLEACVQTFKLLVGNRMKQTKYKVGAEIVKHAASVPRCVFILVRVLLPRYQGAHPSAATVPTTEPELTAPANAEENRPANRRREEPVRMNAAQGGPVLDDDEDDGNRDWLDWVYTLCRFGVLISIVYFYSTLGRFVLVFGFFFVVYLWVFVSQRNYTATRLNTWE